jgi:hypothetical protein
MNSVYPIFTVHEEEGRANIFELHEILAHIRPTVIFLEVPPAAFDDYYRNCSRHNLESKAVRLYRESHQVALVPVDMPTPEREFFESAEYLRKRVRGESPEYRQLMSQDIYYVREYGFSYLNSERCSKLWSDVYWEMQNSVERLAEARLANIFESWKETHDRRENIMMSNVEAYCADNAHERSVFLVGAAHRQPIIDKARGRFEGSTIRVHWDFSSYAS